MLKYQMDTSMFDEDGLETLHTNLLNMFCTKSMKVCSYCIVVVMVTTHLVVLRLRDERANTRVCDTTYC